MCIIIYIYKTQKRTTELTVVLFIDADVIDYVLVHLSQGEIEHFSFIDEATHLDAL